MNRAKPLLACAALVLGLQGCAVTEAYLNAFDPSRKGGKAKKSQPVTTAKKGEEKGFFDKIISAVVPPDGGGVPPDQR